VSFVKTTFTYVGLRVKDLQQSIDVYTNLLGMTLTMKPRAILETEGEIAIVQSDDATFFLELNHYGAESP
jgi:catechol 2,3-dioxygenase-like lactoylglutathione lyase family enzyme